MVRDFGDSQLVRSTLFVVVLALVVSVPMYGQLNPEILTPAEPKVSQNPQDPKQPLAVNPGVGQTISATPEGLRQTEIESEAKRLYQLSAELRAEVAKTYKESLSLSVIKKAEEIEKLAKSLKALMSLEAAASKH